MRAGRAGRRGQEGMALLIVLWTIGVLTLICAIVTTTTRTEVNRARNLLENAKAEGLADAGVYRAIAALLESDRNTRPPVDGTIYRWPFEGNEVLISIQSEAGKVDLNSASDQLLKGLFNSIGVEPDQANQIVAAMRDFSDRDHRRRVLGAEDEDYRAAGMLNGAKDGRFQNVAELKQVMGMTPELYENVVTVITVHSGTKNIDPATAPRMALLALPAATPAKVDLILAARAKALTDRAPWASDPEPGSSMMQSAPQTTDVFAADDQENAESFASDDQEFFEPFASDDQELIDAFAVDEAANRYRHGVFMITATAKTPDGGVFQRVAIVRVREDPDEPFIFHEWRQGWVPSNAQEERASRVEP